LRNVQLACPQYCTPVLSDYKASARQSEVHARTCPGRDLVCSAGLWFRDLDPLQPDAPPPCARRALPRISRPIATGYLVRTARLSVRCAHSCNAAAATHTVRAGLSLSPPGQDGQVCRVTPASLAAMEIIVRALHNSNNSGNTARDDAGNNNSKSAPVRSSFNEAFEQNYPRQVEQKTGAR